MRHAITLCLSTLLLAAPALAQETGNNRASDLEEGMDMMSEGARRLLDGLVGEVEPRMRDLADTLRQFNFEQLDLEDLGAYHPPEVLPNGDIIIRRKRPADDATPMDDEIET